MTTQHENELTYFFFLHTVIYDMKNQEKINLCSGFLKKDVNNKYEFNIAYYRFTDFLTNGDLVTFKDIKIDEYNSQSVVLIYSSNTNNNRNWVCNSVYELNEKEIIFGKISNDRLWVLLNETIFILNLFTFQYRKVPLEINVSIKSYNF